MHVVVKFNEFGLLVEGALKTSEEIYVAVDGFASLSAPSRPKDILQGHALIDAIADGYHRKGLELTRLFHGQFAACIVDKRSQSIVLLNDLIGVKPLFYRLSFPTIAISSRLVSLNGLIDDRESEIDDDYFANYLACGDPIDERTPYKSIKRVLPRQVIVIGRDTVRKSTLNWPEIEREIEYKNKKKYEDELLNRLNNIIRSYAGDNGKIISELSGGLDSSTVFKIAQKVINFPVATFSIVYSKSLSADESEWISRARGTYRGPSMQIDMDEYPHYSSLPNRTFGEPCEAMLVSDWEHRYAEIVSDYDAEVVLTGEGGDSVFSGDSPPPIYLADDLIAGNFRKAWRSASVLRKRIRGERSETHLLYHFALRPLYYNLCRQPQNWIKFNVDWFNSTFERQYDLRNRYRNTNLSRLKSIGRTGQLEAIQRACTGGAHFYQSLSFGDVFRHPFLSRSIVEYMLGVPWNQKCLGEFDRILQRAAMKNILPEATRIRLSKGGSCQTRIRGLEEYNTWTNLVLNESAEIFRRGYIDRNKWKNAVQKARLGDIKNTRLFDAVCMTELWLQQELNG